MKLLAMLLALAAERLFSPYRDSANSRQTWAFLQKLLPVPGFWQSALMPPLLVGLPALAVLLTQRTIDG